jgi:arsenate reductase
MEKEKILFVCIHNSARSQIAEELLRKIAGDRFETASAGIEPGELNPIVVDVLKEEGIDITGKKTRADFDLTRKGNLYSRLITVCDESAAERCPVFPGIARQVHWSFPDPSNFTGTYEEKLDKVRALKEEIKARLQEWIQQTKESV